MPEINSILLPILVFLKENVVGICTLLVTISTFVLVQPLRHSQNEIQIRDMISKAKNKLLELELSIIENKDKDKEEQYKKIKAAYLEDYRNAYDEACAKYLDKKLDRKRFKKMYKDEIKNRYKNDEEFYTENADKYEAICKVYKEWYVSKSIKEKIIDYVENFKLKKELLKVLGIVLLLVALYLVFDNPKIAVAIILIIFAQLCFKNNKTT